jgi:hypothetical protein
VGIFLQTSFVLDGWAVLFGTLRVLLHHNKLCNVACDGIFIFFVVYLMGLL